MVSGSWVCTLSIKLSLNGCSPGRAECGQIDGELERSFKTPNVSLAGSGQIERGAVIDGGTDEGESERDVDGVTEANVFEHGEALIVVHREYRVSMLEVPGSEQGVGGQRPKEMNPLLA